MKSLADLARLAGFQVLVEASPSCVELAGDGRWHILEHEAYRYVKHSLRDHVTIILRDVLGGRELRDLGKKGERRAILPSAEYHWKVPPVSHLHGVKASGKKWAVRVMCHGKCLYIGTFDDAVSAGMAHDRYAIEHGLDNELNFPRMKDLVRQELAGAVAD